ncbi:MAG: roadblock/LC7 domain-containing protein [Acidobacteriota bacterium]|nr:roadblock/LC7 domain-containing protein [Acidobacteriota bacterium]
MFQQILDRLIERVPEALAATFSDRDGEPICTRTIQVPNDALQLLGAYQQTVKRHLAQAIEEFDRGEIEQIAFATQEHWILMMGASEGCTLVLIIHREGILGRARFEMLRAVKALNQEL